MARYSITSDFYILSHAGLAPLYFVMVSAVLLANASAVYFLYRPALVGLKVLYGALVIATLQNAVTVALAFRDLAGVREAYARGREIRCLTVREEALDMIFTPGGMTTSFAVMVVFYAFVAALVHRSRNHFRGAVEVAV